MYRVFPFLDYYTVLVIVSFTVYSISLCDASCHFFNAIPGMRGCVGDGIFVPFGVTIESKACIRCDCYLDGSMDCCKMKVIYRYPPHCKEIPDGPCRTKVVMKNNTSMYCDSFGGVGK